MKQKILPLSVALYILSVFLLICGVLSVIACHKNITAELAQGVPVKGNELAILMLYLQSSVQYLVFSALLYVSGRLHQLFISPRFAPSMANKPEEPPKPMRQEQCDQAHENRPREDVTEFQGWSSNGR